MRKINFQPISKADLGSGHELLVHSVFFTIQGEGPNVGKPAVFVRLGGCNLQCLGCDTEYTQGAVPERIDSIATRVQMAFGDFGGDERLVVITGGEPFRQNLLPFVELLGKRNMRAQIETNGTLGFGEDLKTGWIVTRFRPQIVVSPKAGKVHSDLHEFITAYKYVLDASHIDPRDGLPTSVLGMPAAPARPHADFDGDVYVQPADEPTSVPLGEDYAYPGTNSDNLKATIDSAMKFGYRLCLQMHKIAGLE